MMVSISAPSQVDQLYVFFSNCSVLCFLFLQCPLTEDLFFNEFDMLRASLQLLQLLSCAEFFVYDKEVVAIP